MNPWGAKTLEWTVPNPIPLENFAVLPVVTEDAYGYGEEQTPEPEPAPVSAGAAADTGDGGAGAPA
jgi:cytochrome c oxidase subunit 1